MAKESDEVAGVNLPANVCFTHDGSNTLYVGNALSKSDGKEESKGGTAIVGCVERMVLQPSSGCIMIYVDDSQGKPGRLLLTPSGMLIIMKGEPKEPKK